MRKASFTEIAIYHEIKKYLAHRDVMLLDTTRCASCSGMPDFIVLGPGCVTFLEVKKQSDWVSSTGQYYFQWSIADYFQRHQFKEVNFSFLVVDNTVPFSEDTEVWYHNYPIRKTETYTDKDDEFNTETEIIDETLNFKITTFKNFMEYLCGENNIK